VLAQHAPHHSVDPVAAHQFHFLGSYPSPDRQDESGVVQRLYSYTPLFPKLRLVAQAQGICVNRRVVASSLMP
jgi:hypothetical protein